MNVVMNEVQMDVEAKSAAVLLMYLPNVAEEPECWQCLKHICRLPRS